MIAFKRVGCATVACRDTIVVTHCVENAVCSQINCLVLQEIPKPNHNLTNCAAYVTPCDVTLKEQGSEGSITMDHFRRTMLLSNSHIPHLFLDANYGS
jgi:hypothetical protein